MHIFSHNAFRYGLLMTLLHTVWILFMHISGKYGLESKAIPFDFLFIAFMPLIIWFLGIRARKIAKKGKLSLKDGVKEGFHISLVYGLLSPIVYAIYYLFINPQVVGTLKPEYGLPGVSDMQIILIDMLAQFVSAIIFGTLYAVVISLFLRSKAKGK